VKISLYASKRVREQLSFYNKAHSFLCIACFVSCVIGLVDCMLVVSFSSLCLIVLLFWQNKGTHK